MKSWCTAQWFFTFIFVQTYDQIKKFLVVLKELILLPTLKYLTSKNLNTFNNKKDTLKHFFIIIISCFYFILTLLLK